MAEQHIKLLQGLGIGQEVIDEIEAVTPEAAKDWNPETVSPAVRAALKTTLKDDFMNDNDFLNSIPDEKVPETVRKRIESGQYTRFQKELLETATKQLGLAETDLADLTEEDRKSIKKTMVRIAEKHLAKTGVKGLQGLQKEVTDLTEKLEQANGDWETKMNTELEKVNGAANSKVVKALVRAELIGLPDIDLGVPVAYVTDPVLAKLTAKYAVVLDGDELALRQKENNQLAVLVNGKPLTIQEALKSIVIEDKIGKLKDGKPGTPARKTTIVVGGEHGSEGAIELGSNIADKINANAALEKD